MKIGHSVPTHHIGVDMVAGGRNLSYVEEEVSELKHVIMQSIWLHTSIAEGVRSDGIPLSADTLTSPACAFFLTFKGRFRTPSVKESGTMMKFFWQLFFDLKV